MMPSEFGHLIQNLSQKQAGDDRKFRVGHVAKYDPELHAVEVLFPLEKTVDDKYMISPLIPICSPWVGDSFGIQIAPFGGSSQDEPTKGEPCIVEIIERSFGNCFAAAYIFSTKFRPPDQLLNPGEAVIKHKKGAFIKFELNGNVVVQTAAQDVDDPEGGDIILNSSRDVLVQAYNEIVLAALSKVKVVTPNIDLDAGNSALNIKIIADSDVNIDADGLAVNVLCRESNLVANDSINMTCNDFHLYAANSIVMDSPFTHLSGQHIVIGNENNDTNTTSTIRIDAVDHTQSIGRFDNKFMGTFLKIGAVDNADAFNARRIDILANAGGLAGNVIGIQSTGADGEIYTDCQNLSVCGGEIAVGRRADNSPGAQAAGAREASHTVVYSIHDTQILGHEAVHVTAETGFLWASGHTFAQFSSPTSVNVYCWNFGAGDVHGALVMSATDVRLTRHTDEATIVLDGGSIAIDAHASGTFLNLMGHDQVKLLAGVPGSNAGNVNIVACASVNSTAGFGGGGLGAITLNSPNTIELNAEDLIDMVVSEDGGHIDMDADYIAGSAGVWFRFVGIGDEFSGVAAQNLMVCKGGQTYIGRDEGQFGELVIVAAADTVTVGSLTDDVNILAGNQVYVNGLAANVIDSTDCFIGWVDDDTSAYRLATEDFVLNIFNEHTHGGVTTGGGHTDTPDPLSSGAVPELTLYAKAN